MSLVVIGGGQAAASLVQKFRSLNETGDVTIISDEAYPPYQRPPLSKKYLAGEMEIERLYLKPLAWYKENNIDLRLKSRVKSIDRDASSVSLQNGETIQYDNLVFATGSRARELPKTVTKNANNVYTVRSIDDINTMLPEFEKGRNLIVIGGGYIGLEAASIARKFEMNVTVIEAAPRILGRVAAKETADMIRNLHHAHGVEIIEDEMVENYNIVGDRLISAKLRSGRELGVDVMIVGIGILPNSELAEAAGLECDDGILVDEFGRTNDENIYAAGDCTRFDYKGERVRIESVGNAIDQGEVVAANLAGVKTSYLPKPWFWSDQFDMTLQIAGWNAGFDNVITRVGNPKGESVWYYQGDQLIAVDALGDPRAYMIAKRVIEAGKNIPKSAVSDPDADLKSFM